MHLTRFTFPRRAFALAFGLLLAGVVAGCSGSGNGSSSTGTPTVTSVSPPGGVGGGGATVTVNGTNLVSVGNVYFGSTAATSFTVDPSGNFITATAPSGTGTVDITVTTAYGTSSTSSADHFTYSSGLTITTVSPSSVGSGTAVTITGTGFTGVQSVNFGSTTGSFTVNSPTSITVTVPNLGTTAQNYYVTVTTTAGTSNQVPWYYNP